jgi:hypothetical protein
MTYPAASAPAERLILAGVRAWGLARLSREAPQARVRAALSAVSSDAVGALFVGWMEAIERHARRAFHLGCLGCGRASADEQRLVAACGLAAMAYEAGEALLAPLQIDPGPAMILARALNAALEADGLPLPARLEIGSIEGALTVH